MSIKLEISLKTIIGAAGGYKVLLPFVGLPEGRTAPTDAESPAPDIHLQGKIQNVYKDLSQRN